MLCCVIDHQRESVCVCVLMLVWVWSSLPRVRTCVFYRDSFSVKPLVFEKLFADLCKAPLAHRVHPMTSAEAVNLRVDSSTDTVGSAAAKRTRNT